MRNPYLGVYPLTADKFLGKANVARGVLIIATVAGNITLKFRDGSSISYPFGVGKTQWDDVAIVGYSATGTTGTITSVNALL